LTQACTALYFIDQHHRRGRQHIPFARHQFIRLGAGLDGDGQYFQDTLFGKKLGRFL